MNRRLLTLIGLAILGSSACSKRGTGSLPPSAPVAGPTGGNSAEAPFPGTSVPGPAPRGAESSASAPSMPYVPTEPYEYRCELKWQGYLYPSDVSLPRETWVSRSIVIIDSRKTFYRGDDIKWGNFYSRAERGMPEAFGPATSAVPYPLAATALAMSFTPSGLGTSVRLQVTVPIEENSKLARYVTLDKTNGFTDKVVSAEMNYSFNDRVAHTSFQVHSAVVCERTK